MSCAQLKASRTARLAVNFLPRIERGEQLEKTLCSRCKRGMSLQDNCEQADPDTREKKEKEEAVPEKLNQLMAMLTQLNEDVAILREESQEQLKELCSGVAKLQEQLADQLPELDDSRAGEEKAVTTAVGAGAPSDTKIKLTHEFWKGITLSWNPATQTRVWRRADKRGDRIVQWESPLVISPGFPGLSAGDLDMCFRLLSLESDLPPALVKAVLSTLIPVGTEIRTGGKRDWIYASPVSYAALFRRMGQGARSTGYVDPASGEPIPGFPGSTDLRLSVTHGTIEYNFVR